MVLRQTKKEQPEKFQNAILRSLTKALGHHMNRSHPNANHHDHDRGCLVLQACWLAMAHSMRPRAPITIVEVLKVRLLIANHSERQIVPYS